MKAIKLICEHCGGTIVLYGPEQNQGAMLKIIDSESLRLNLVHI